MDIFPCIEVSFVVEGKYFNLEQFTKEIGILPSRTRGVDDWPKTIKNNLNIPKELQPRCEWYICRKAEVCSQVEIPISSIMSQLRGKEQKLIEFCEEHNLQKGLSITIHAEAMNLPEIVLPSSMVSYIGSLKVEIGFDIYVH